MFLISRDPRCICVVNGRVAAAATQRAPQERVTSVSEGSSGRACKMWHLSADCLEMTWYPWGSSTSGSLSFFFHCSLNGQHQAWNAFIKTIFFSCRGYTSLAMGLWIVQPALHSLGQWLLDLFLFGSWWEIVRNTFSQDSMCEYTHTHTEKYFNGITYYWMHWSLAHFILFPFFLIAGGSSFNLLWLTNAFPFAVCKTLV